MSDVARPHIPSSGRALPHEARYTALLREAWRTALPPWRTIAPTILYCLRTLAAVTLALYTAFSLQLESPLSSVVTVLIVANPVTGALVSKSVWRLLGTAIGATAAVLLMASFGQSPVLFAAAFSLCIGAACIASTLLRFFKAYGAVLAGYTIIIVCSPAFADPGNVFTSAIARLSAVAVGIASAAAVFLLTNVRPPSRLGNVTAALIRSTGATLARYAIAQPQAADPGMSQGRFHDQRGALLAQADGLHEIIEYAAADSYAIARREGRLRLGAAGLMGTLTALNPLLGRIGRHEAFADEVHPALVALASLDGASPGAVLDRLAGTRDRLAASYETPSGDASQAGLDRLASIEHAHDLLARLHDAVSRLTLPPGALHSRHAGVRLRLFLDWPTALRNGARGSIVTMLAFMFWYVTQWTAGPTLLSYLVPAACLLATNPSASRASIDFSIGTLLAIPASFVCEMLLPQINGFPLLIGTLAIFMLPGIWFQFHPRYVLRAFGYVVFFNAMISVNNPIRFDDIALFNNWLAFVMGTAALVVVFRALLPSNPRRDADRLVRSITAAVARLGRRRSSLVVEVWESLQMQKASRLIQRLQTVQSPDRQQIIDCSFIAIELGRYLIRLRKLLGETVPDHPQQREACMAVLAAASRLRHDPHAVASLARDAASRLIGDAALLPSGRRLAAILHEIATLIEAIPDFLAPDFTLQDFTLQDFTLQDFAVQDFTIRKVAIRDEMAG